MATAAAASGIILVLMLWASGQTGFNEAFYGGITIGLGLVSTAALMSERLAPSASGWRWFPSFSVQPGVSKFWLGLPRRHPVKSERVYNQPFTVKEFVTGKAGWYVYAAMGMATCGLLFLCLSRLS